MIDFKLKDYMDKNSLSIQDVHDFTGISRNTISQMYNKTPKGIQFDTLDKLLINLKVDLEDILTFIPPEKEKFVIEDVTKDYNTELTETEDADGNVYVDEIVRSYDLILHINQELEVTINFSIVCAIDISLSNKNKEITNLTISMFDKSNEDALVRIIGKDVYSEFQSKLEDFLIEDFLDQFPEEIDNPGNMLITYKTIN